MKISRLLIILIKEKLLIFFKQFLRFYKYYKGHFLNSQLDSF